MDRLLKAILVLIIIIGTIFIIVTLSRTSEGAVPKSWTVADAIQKGTVWGGKKAVGRAKKMFALWYPVYWRYGGGSDPATLALTTGTETAWTGNPLGSTNDSVLGETGLLSVKRALARHFDVNACEAEQNVWAACKAKQLRRESLYKRYWWAEKLSDSDQGFLQGMIGGAGAGATQCLLKGSNAKEILQGRKWKGSLQNIVYGWIREEGENLRDEKYDKCWGRTNAVVVTFRVFRLHGVRRVVNQMYGKNGAKRRKACTRPLSLLDSKPPGHYPGDEMHGQCSPPPSAWNKPPLGHRYKNTKKGKVDLWARYCVGDCTPQSVHAEWIKEKQMEGLLPSDAAYESAKEEMERDGCWIL